LLCKNKQALGGGLQPFNVVAHQLQFMVSASWRTLRASMRSSNVTPNL
jgi:hypothetical protein